MSCSAATGSSFPVCSLLSAKPDASLHAPGLRATFLVKMVIDKLRRRAEMPSTARGLPRAARDTALAVPKWCSSARLRAGPIPLISSSGFFTISRLAPRPVASRWRSGAPRRAAAGRNRAPDRAAAARRAGVPFMKKRSRPASRSMPLATPIAVDRVVDAELVEDRAHRRHLALSAVDQQQVRPGREGAVVLLVRVSASLRPRGLVRLAVSP